MPELDMGRGSYMIAKIRRAFEHAYQLLTVALQSSNDSMESISYLGYVIRGDDASLIARIPMTSSAAASSSSNANHRGNTHTPTSASKSNSKSKSKSSEDNIDKSQNKRQKY